MGAVKKLVELGASVNFAASYGPSPLQEASPNIKVMRYKEWGGFTWELR
jgi:hypothetical protein